MGFAYECTYNYIYTYICSPNIMLYTYVLMITSTNVYGIHIIYIY